jgi:N-acetylglucosamine kinase-like BadF-type ATPase
VAFFLGIDGGGSKTTCLVGDENSILGRGASAGSNLVRVGEARARESLCSAVRQACAAAGIPRTEIARACVGVAGARHPHVRDFVGGVLLELVPAHTDVVGDAVIALAAAFGPGPGVIAIAGTGSVAYGRNAAGHTAHAGGWGFAISDEGSGHWIGRTAVSGVMRAYDEVQGEADAGSAPLLAGILRTWGVRSHEQLVLAANATPARDFAGLFPAVLQAADAGDLRARDVLARAGAELAGLANIAIRKLFSDAGTARLAMAGGVFGCSALVREVFYNSVHSEYPSATLNPTVIEPVNGALEMARRGTRV